MSHVLSLSDRLLFLIAVKMTETVESQQANGDHESSYENTSSGGDTATPDQVCVYLNMCSNLRTKICTQVMVVTLCHTQMLVNASQAIPMKV